MGSIGGMVARGLGDVMTFGTNELVGNPIGKIAEGGFGALNPTKPVPTVGQMSPMQMLQMTGGASLLGGIALGGSVTQELANFVGIPIEGLQALIANPDDPSALRNTGVDAATAKQLKGLHEQLSSISQDTTQKTQAVQKLVNDFPDFMSQKISQYKGIADQATADAAQKALDQVAAKYAANGGLSSGAMAAASARTAADMAKGNLDFGANLAGQDWMQRFNSANALLSFQQKMLGQGATQGFNAVQNMLNQNQENARQGAGFQQQNNQTDSGIQNAMFGALGGAAGGALGPVLKNLFTSSPTANFPSKPSSTGSGKSGFTSSPDLNLGGSGFGLNRYTPNS